MTNQPTKAFDPIPEIDFSQVLTAKIGRRSNDSDSVTITKRDKTSQNFYATKYGKDGIIALVKQVRAAALVQKTPYFNIASGSTWGADDHMFYFSAPSKIKKLTDAQKHVLVTFAKAVYHLAWYKQYGTPNPRFLDGKVVGEKAATNINTLRKLCEYGLIGTDDDIASTWRQWHVTEAGLAYVEANLPEDTQAVWFKVWDDRERASIASDLQHDENVAICRKIIANISNIELVNVGSRENPFDSTKFECVFGGRTYAILHNSQIEIVTPNYNSRNPHSAFIGKDNALVYAKALEQIAVLMAEIATYNASNS